MVSHWVTSECVAIRGEIAGPVQIRASPATKAACYRSQELGIWFPQETERQRKEAGSKKHKINVLERGFVPDNGNHFERLVQEF